jgi:diaminopimelate decarboxylase
MTFDSIEELEKIVKHFPKAEPVLRIATKFSDAIWNLNEKFGTPIEDVPAIL